MTFSPIHLVFPVVEVTAEIRAHDKVGVAVIGGAGRYSETTNGLRVSAAVYEVGAQIRYYLLGDFRHGMQIGAELLYLHLSDSNLSATGEGLAVGPFLGYKIITDVGFTFDTQLGFEHVGARAARNNGSGDQNSSSDNIPLLNLNVGWSF